MMKNKKIMTPPGYVPSVEETRQEEDKRFQAKQEIVDSEKKDSMLKNV